jgi:hypothetical protein
VFAAESKINESRFLFYGPARAAHNEIEKFCFSLFASALVCLGRVAREIRLPAGLIALYWCAPALFLAALCGCLKTA